MSTINPLPICHAFGTYSPTLYQYSFLKPWTTQFIPKRRIPTLPNSEHGENQMKCKSNLYTTAYFRPLLISLFCSSHCWLSPELPHQPPNWSPSLLPSTLTVYSHTVAGLISLHPLYPPSLFLRINIIPLHIILQWFPITMRLKFIFFCQGPLGIQGLNPPYSSWHSFTQLQPPIFLSLARIKHIPFLGTAQKPLLPQPHMALLGLLMGRLRREAVFNHPL